MISGPGYEYLLQVARIVSGRSRRPYTLVYVPVGQPNPGKEISACTHGYITDLLKKGLLLSGMDDSTQALAQAKQGPFRSLPVMPALRVVPHLRSENWHLNPPEKRYCLADMHKQDNLEKVSPVLDTKSLVFCKLQNLFIE
jgi:hypothetical protein